MSKKKKCECPAGEKWAVPYADFLSLLLALFIALYALASVNMEKQKALKEEFIKIYKFPSANIVEEQTKQEKAMTDEPSDDNVEGKKVIVHTLENKEEQEQNQNNILSDVVDEESIAEIISRWTHIPVSKLVSSEKDKLLHLFDRLKMRVIGQDNALKLVSDAILKSRSGIKDPNRPIGSFMFLGPTGVGKTEVARSLAYELFDDEKHMIRIDMSE